MQKQIVVGGFTEEQRQKELENLKTKLSKKGYRFLDYQDNGALKSVAIFEVDEAQLRKEKAQKMYLLAAFFFVISAILFFKAS